MRKPSSAPLAHLQRIFGPSLLSKTGTTTDTDKALANKVVGVYVGSMRCPPCNTFKPRLISKYQEFLGNNLPFEIVFASTDADEQDFNSNRADMPWLAVPFKDRNTLLNQVSNSGTLSTPTLIVYDNLGNILTKNGVQDIFGSTSNWFVPKTISNFEEIRAHELIRHNDPMAFIDGCKGRVLFIDEAPDPIRATKR